MLIRKINYKARQLESYKKTWLLLYPELSQNAGGRFLNLNRMPNYINVSVWRNHYKIAYSPVPRFYKPLRGQIGQMHSQRNRTLIFNCVTRWWRLQCAFDAKWVWPGDDFENVNHESDWIHWESFRERANGGGVIYSDWIHVLRKLWRLGD